MKSNISLRYSDGYQIYMKEELLLWKMDLEPQIVDLSSWRLEDR